MGFQLGFEHEEVIPRRRANIHDLGSGNYQDHVEYILGIADVILLSCHMLRRICVDCLVVLNPLRESMFLLAPRTANLTVMR